MAMELGRSDRKFLRDMTIMSVKKVLRKCLQSDKLTVGEVADILILSSDGKTPKEVASWIISNRTENQALRGWVRLAESCEAVRSIFR